MFETGVKVIDLIQPFLKGGKIGLFGGAGVGKTVVIHGIDQQRRQAARRLFRIRRRGRAHSRRQRSLAGDDGVRRHQARANRRIESRADLWPDDRAAWSASARGADGLDRRRVLPRRRGRATHCCSSTTFSASPRPARKYPRCWAACPAPSATSRTWRTEMGELQERITSTKKGSVTSVQAIYVPADDFTDPAPATTFAHLDATTVLSRALTEIGTLPGGRSPGFYLAHSRSTHRGPGTLRCRAVGEEDSAELQRSAGHHRHSRHR